MEQKTFFAEIMRELKRRAEAAQAAGQTVAPDEWDVVNESLSMKGRVSNPHAGYGQMGDMLQGL